jgi:DNA recombination protein RmuC
VVELAIKIPATDGSQTLLPVDSKFPLDHYSRLVDAYEVGDAVGILASRKALEKALLVQAKKITDLYCQPPYTTDVVVLFVPFE